MDLMTLAAKIIVDDSGFNQGIEVAEKKGKALAGKMSAMTVAVGNIASDMIKKGIDGIKNVIDGAISGYANYEQLVGGVETLFKSSANRIQKYARESFKTTGLSANEYMETVTSFSASLIQGLKGDTETAAEVANMAVTDMADNANKMGTDMSSIQAAYQGFAKQNYTMLDNLKLGYGGTASEMVRLVNDSKILDHEIKDLDGITFDQLVQAIHAIQDQLGVTGTTAEEAASTIGGSENSLKSAWKDLLTAVAGTDESTTKWFNDPLNDTLKNFQESFSTYIDNLVPTIVNSVANSGTLVEGIADAIASLPTDLLSKISEEGIESATDMVNGVSKITGWLIDSITNMFTSAAASDADVANLGAAIGQFLGKTISDIVSKAPEIMTSIVDIGISLSGGLIQGLFEGLFGKDAEVDKIVKGLEQDLTDIDVNSGKATGILRYMDKMYEKMGKAAQNTAEWKAAQEELEKVLPGSGEVWKTYKGDVEGAIDALEKFSESTRHAAIVAGMQKATHAAYELLGEQETQKAEQEMRRESARETMNYELDRIKQEIYDKAEGEAKDYVREHLDMDSVSAEDQETYKTESGEFDLDAYLEKYIVGKGDWGDFFLEHDFDNETSYDFMENLLELAKGRAWNGEEFETLDDYTFGQLQELLANYGMKDAVDIEGAIASWTAAKNEFDDATSKIKDLNTEIEATTEKIGYLEKAADRAEEEWRKSGQKENKPSVDELAAAKEALNETADGIDGTQNAIKAANKKIELEGNAVESASGEIKEAGTNAADTIQSGGSTASKAIMTGGEKIGKALDKIAEQLEKFKVSVPKQSGNSDDDSGDSDSSDTQLAVGMDYVPSNGYKAELHEGEAVLTKAENKQRMSGSNADIVGAIQSLRQDLQNLRIVVGQKVFGHAVVDYGGDGLNRYISGANSRYEAGYGV